MIRDAIGNPLNEGDAVVLQVGNELSFGQVVKVEEGSLLRATSLVETANQTKAQVQQQQPFIVVQIAVPRIVTADGLASGVIKVQTPDKS